jgi:hypothetical protein
VIQDKLYIVTFHIGDGMERLPGSRHCLILIAPDADAAKELAPVALQHPPDLRIDGAREVRYAVVAEQYLDLPDSRPRLEHL